VISRDERQANHATIVPELGFQQVIGILRRRANLFSRRSVGTILAGIAEVCSSHPNITATAQVFRFRLPLPSQP